MGGTLICPFKEQSMPCRSQSLVLPLGCLVAVVELSSAVLTWHIQPSYALHTCLLLLSLGVVGPGGVSLYSPGKCHQACLLLSGTESETQGFPQAVGHCSLIYMCPQSTFYF